MSRLRLLSVLVVLSLVTLAPGSAASLERPTWTPGDTWTYRTNTTLTAGLNLTGTIVSTVTGRLPVPSDGGSVDAYRVVLSGSGTASGAVTTSSGNVRLEGTWILTAEEHFEPDGLQPLYDLLDLSVNGTYQGVLPFSIRVQNTTTYQVLAGDWAYPLAPGSNGTLTVGYNFTQDFSISGPASGSTHDQGTGEWIEAFSIGAPLAVATPAGSFQAYPITETWSDGSRQISFAAPQAGNDVRTGSYGPDGNLTAVTVLTAYRYQALEAPTFLGLTALEWGIVGPVVAAVVVGVLVLRRHRLRKRARSPDDPGAEDLTSGPRGP